MPLEEGLITRNALHPHDVVRANLNDLIDHEERIAVGQELTDAIDI